MMTINMIPILCNIACKNIRFTWLKKYMPPLLTLCGQMAMYANSNHINLGILWDIILI